MPQILRMSPEELRGSPSLTQVPSAEGSQWRDGLRKVKEARGVHSYSRGWREKLGQLRVVATWPAVPAQKLWKKAVLGPQQPAGSCADSKLDWLASQLSG